MHSRMFLLNPGTAVHQCCSIGRPSLQVMATATALLHAAQEPPVHCAVCWLQAQGSWHRNHISTLRNTTHQDIFKHHKNEFHRNWRQVLLPFPYNHREYMRVSGDARNFPAGCLMLIFHWRWPWESNLANSERKSGLNKLLFRLFPLELSKQPGS